MKRLAVYLDGTWDAPSARTNAFRLYDITADVDDAGVEQLRWYREGVGARLSERLSGGILGTRHEDFARRLEPGTFSSLHFDLVHGKPMELDALHGELVRRARRAQVPVPVAQTIHGVLRPWAVRNDPHARSGD
jgi:hypothetical protein